MTPIFEDVSRKACIPMPSVAILICRLFFSVSILVRDDMRHGNRTTRYVKRIDIEVSRLALGFKKFELW